MDGGGRGDFGWQEQPSPGWPPAGQPPPPDQWAPPGQQVPPFGAPPPGQYGPAPQQSTNGFAIAALVLGILGGVLLSAIFGFVALGQIKRTGQRGRGLAIAGIVLSVVWAALIAAGILFAIGSGAQRDTSGVVAEGGNVDVVDIELGDCLNDLQEESVVLSVKAVPCAEPHEGQVYAVTDLPDGPWPGDEKMLIEAEQRCTDQLAEDFPELYEDTSVEIFFFHPTSASWRGGDRELACVAEYTQGSRTGTILR